MDKENTFTSYGRMVLRSDPKSRVSIQPSDKLCKKVEKNSVQEMKEDYAKFPPEKLKNQQKRNISNRFSEKMEKPPKESYYLSRKKYKLTN
ncbi:unnamed protein product [Larinioides sclopetarius]|uniref:Uncharacterized protein n=1 Tax=Larinioides sclopetarius TaxID=280406 RepID=A0AAV2A8V8_9ARAC